MYGKQNRRRGNYNRSRMIVKAVLCLVGIIVLLFVVCTYKNNRLMENKMPYVQVKEILPFMEALITLNEEVVLQNAGSGIMDLQNRLRLHMDEEERYLTYGELQIILETFPVDAGNLKEEYRDESWKVGVRDWNYLVECFVENYGRDHIVMKDTLLLGMAGEIFDESREPVLEGMVYTGEQLLNNRYCNIGKYLFSNARAVIYENELLTVIGYAKEKGILRNVYFSDISDEKVHFFYDGYHMIYESKLMDFADGKYENGRELRIITDIVLDEGKISIADEKSDYVHGKLLQVSEDAIEIEGYGRYQTDEKMQIYKEYGEIASLNRDALRIGYAYSDFVVEDRKIVACLIIKEEDMDSIRVLLKNSDMIGRHHKEVKGYCNRDCEWIVYEDGVEKERKIINKGEIFHIDKKDIERSGKRIKIVPMALSGEITLESIDRSSGKPSYHGTIEITGEEEGLIIINEVLLEDYLCKVVPSEMPSSYPKEALMAQTVCARTYAYEKMLHAGLPEYGAHVDDSAGFQVYNNIAEQASATEAVKATHNRIAVYDNKPIGAYYYSTSCGMGSDVSIWHGAAKIPGYLQAKEIGTVSETEEVVFADAEFTPQSLMEEDTFKKWITGVKDSNYESQEGWYRWSYKVDNLEAAHIEEVLKSRYASNPNLILTLNGNAYESMEIQSMGKILDIQIVKRLPGGVADELVITGSKETIKVISELNIRYVLADGVTKVKRQTNDEADAKLTLPSAFIILETEKKNGIVDGYTIIGGGFGHGVGMSQNGAKNMAQAGMTYEDILTFFYPGTNIITLSSEEES